MKDNIKWEEYEVEFERLYKSFKNPSSDNKNANFITFLNLNLEFFQYDYVNGVHLEKERDINIYTDDDYFDFIQEYHSFDIIYKYFYNKLLELELYRSLGNYESYMNKWIELWNKDLKSSVISKEDTEITISKDHFGLIGESKNLQISVYDYLVSVYNALLLDVDSLKGFQVLEGKRGEEFVEKMKPNSKFKRGNYYFFKSGQSNIIVNDNNEVVQILNSKGVYFIMDYDTLRLCNDKIKKLLEK